VVSGAALVRATWRLTKTAELAAALEVAFEAALTVIRCG
jgi:hypothetical protein